MGGAGGGGKGAGHGAVEAVADAEAVADELVDARDRAAGVRALRAEENQRGVRLGRRARVGALVGEFAGEMDVVGLGPEVQFDAEREEVGGGFAAAFGADHFPDAGERGGGHGGAGKSRKGGGRGRETRGEGAEGLLRRGAARKDNRALFQFGGRGREGFLGLRAEGFEVFDLGEEIAGAGLQFAEGAVVTFAEAGEVFADVFEVGEEAGEFVVEQAAAGGDRLDVFRLPVLFPEAGDGLEGDEEGGGGAENHPAVEGPLVERAVVFGGEDEGGFEGHEHEHVVGRDEFAGVFVFLGAELLDVGADGGGVFAGGGEAGGVIGGVDGAFVGDEGHFRVDDEVAGVGEAKDDVGAEAAAVGGGERFLGEVVLTFEEAGGFEEAVEDEFAPGTAGLGLTLEGGGQGVGFVGDAGVEEAELFDLGFEGGAVVALGFVDGVHACAEIGELLADGMEEGLDLGFVVVGELGGFFFEEAGGDGLEFGLEGGPEFFSVGEGAGGEGLAFEEALLFGGELGGEGGAVGGELGGKLRMESGELREVGAGGGEFGGEPCAVGVGGVKFGGAGRGAAAEEEPGEGARERGGGQSDDRKKHVKDCRESVSANQCRMHALTREIPDRKHADAFRRAPVIPPKPSDLVPMLTDQIPAAPVVTLVEKPPVLVVDDEYGPRESIAFTLASEFAVDTSDRAKDALGKLRARSYAAVVLDIRMPEMDGIRALEEIRKIDPYVSVIMLTGYGTLLTAQQAMAAGANQYLRKPPDITELIESVRRQTQATRLRRAQAALAREAIDSNAALKREIERNEPQIWQARASVELVHDLNNPLTVVIGYASLLAEEARILAQRDPDAATKLLDYSAMVEKAAEYCHHLSENWRMSAKQAPAFARVDLVQVVAEVRQVIFFGNVAIQTTGLSEAWVRGAKFELMRVLQNLFKNALEAGATRLTVAFTPQAGRLEMSVVDNGAGMDPERLKRALHGGYSSKSNGTGLGLSICRHLAGTHGATFAVESAIGQGTTVRVLFPVAPTE